MRKLAHRVVVVAFVASTMTHPLVTAEASRLASAHVSGRVAIAANLIVLDGIAAERLDPVRAARLLAYTSVAMARAARNQAAPELAVSAAAAGNLDGLLSGRAEPARRLAAEIRTRLGTRGMNPGQVAPLSGAGHRSRTGCCHGRLETAPTQINRYRCRSFLAPGSPPRRTSCQLWSPLRAPGGPGTLPAATPTALRRHPAQATPRTTRRWLRCTRWQTASRRARQRSLASGPMYPAASPPPDTGT